MDALDASGFWSHEGAITLEERTYRCLHDAIINGGLAPGMRLVSSQVATRLGVSRTTTTNAIKRLANDGLVVLRPHSDATVASLNLATLHEVFAIRNALEDLIMGEAARQIEPEALAGLARITDEIAESIADGDSERYRRLERAYHLQIYAAANMPMLAAIVTDLWNRLEPYRGRRYSGKALLDSTVREHREIEAALAERNCELATDAMRRHVQTGLQQIAAAIERVSASIDSSFPSTSTRRRHAIRPASAPNTRPMPGSLRASFAELHDHRRGQGKVFEHAGVLTLAACSMFCGATSRYAITRWGQRCHPEIRHALGLPSQRAPSGATIHRVLSNLPGERFVHMLAQWAAQHDLQVTGEVDGESYDPELHGVHGEKLPGIGITSDLVTRYRHAHAMPAGERDSIRSLPALILTGTRSGTSMQLAVLELHQEMLHPTR